MVKLLHREGIEVILDVVYNHTAEQDRTGATLSWRGLDQRAYYRLDERGRDIDVTGCGNTLDLRHPVRLPDGARLAALLGAGVPRRRLPLRPRRRRSAAAVATSSTPTTRSSSPCAPTRCSRGSSSSPSRGTSACTAGAPGSSRRRSWSGTTATATPCARFWLGDVRAQAARPARGTACRTSPPGSPARATCSATATAGRPRRSTSSPRTTASRSADLTSYDHKHNEANGEDNRDGSNGNTLVEPRRRGPDRRRRPSSRPAARTMRNLLGTLLLSTGVPMVNAGDEIGRTQGGNNNAYCQDNETSVDRLGPRALAGATCSRRRSTSSRVRRELPGAAPAGLGPRAGRCTTTAAATWSGTPPTAPRWASAGTTPATRVVQMYVGGAWLGADSALVVVNGGGPRAPR